MHNYTDMSTKQKQKKYFAEESTAEVEIKRSAGSFVYDTKGKKYIDFLMGWCVGNMGWGNEVTAKAIQNFKGPDYVYPGLLYKPWTELAELLAEITPGKLGKSYRTTGGTESVETAMQIAMVYTGRKKFISIEGSYHGNSIATLSLGDSESNKDFPNLLPHCMKLKPPLNEAALDRVENMLRDKKVAAFIMEPVICNLSVLIPDKTFMTGLQKLCNKYGTLLVMDEVATGFGRTGKLFATEHFNIEPDILCIAKAITDGHAGMGAVITTDKIGNAVKDKVSIYSTYGWHPLSVDVALANIRYMQKHKKSIIENVEEMSSYFRTRLSSMKFKKQPVLHIIGLAIAVDVKDKDYASTVKEKCLKKGLLLSVQENYLVMFPALNIDKKTIEKGLKILEECI
jgi:adenosylmethionine-8-amino-7-oxononanoate aminotransferase